MDKLTRQMKKGQSGFTLIELMITIAIIGILAAIAVPSYLSYTEKARFSEVVMATSPFKMAVDLCSQSTGTLTACANGQNGVPSAAGASGEVTSVSVAANGTITATSVDTDTYILVPTRDATSGQVTWVIGATSTCLAKAYC